MTARINAIINACRLLDYEDTKLKRRGEAGEGGTLATSIYMLACFRTGHTRPGASYVTNRHISNKLIVFL